MAHRELTDKQKAWAEAYVGQARFNASEAARIAGLAEAEGRRCRTKPHVIDYVETLQAERLQSRIISQDRTIEEIVAVGLSDLTDVLEVTETGVIVRDLAGLPRHVTSAIKKIKMTRRKNGEEWEDVLEIEMHDKLKALALLAQYQGLLNKDGQQDETPPFAGLEIVAPTSVKGG